MSRPLGHTPVPRTPPSARFRLAFEKPRPWYKRLFSPLRSGHVVQDILGNALLAALMLAIICITLGVVLLAAALIDLGIMWVINTIVATLPASWHITWRITFWETVALMFGLTLFRNYIRSFFHPAAPAVK